MAYGPIGPRIAAYRRRRGLSQAALAGLVGRSESWLSQVERGLRSVERLPLLNSLASVLRVPVEALTESAEPLTARAADPTGDVARVRQFFASHSGLFDTSLGDAAPRSAVAARIATAHRDYQAARYDRATASLPQLLTDAEAANRGARNDREQASNDLVAAYVLAAKLVTKMGVSDLALLAADRGATVSAGAESWPGRGLAAYQVACALIRIDRVNDAERLAVQLAERMQPAARSTTPGFLSAAGALWLIAAIAASYRHDRPEALRRLDAAERLATQLGYDGNHGWTAFGPTNVAIHRVSVSVRLGDASAAVRSAALIDTDRLPAGLLGRRTQLHLDVAGAHLQRRETADALLHLLAAERVAPQSIRRDITAQNLVRAMLGRSSYSTSSVIHDLAVRAGVLA